MDSYIDNLPSYFGKKVKEERLRKAMTQAELADAIGVSVNTVQGFEKGTLPRTKTLVALANVFECTTDHLLRSGSISSLNIRLLRRSIEIVEHEAEASGNRATAAEKARTISRVYSDLADSVAEYVADMDLEKERR